MNIAKVPLGWITLLMMAGGCAAPEPPVPPPVPTRMAFKPGGDDIAGRSFPSPLTVESAEHILVATEIFRLPGESARQIQAFNVVLDQPDAEARLKRIAQTGGIPGRLYATCGLLLIAPAEGKRVARSLSLLKGDVKIGGSDYSHSIPVARAVVFVLLDDLPRRFRDQRERTYEYFLRSG